MKKILLLGFVPLMYVLSFAGQGTVTTTTTGSASSGVITFSQEDYPTLPVHGTIIKAEKLTTEEQVELQVAEEELLRAEQHLGSVKEKIGDQHKMVSKTWWSGKTWIEVDGDWIIWHGQRVSLVEPASK